MAHRHDIGCNWCASVTDRSVPRDGGTIVPSDRRNVRRLSRLLNSQVRAQKWLAHMRPRRGTRHRALSKCESQGDDERSRDLRSPRQPWTDAGPLLVSNLSHVSLPPPRPLPGFIRVCVTLAQPVDRRRVVTVRHEYATISDGLDSGPSLSRVPFTLRRRDRNPPNKRACRSGIRSVNSRKENPRADGTASRPAIASAELWPGPN